MGRNRNAGREAVELLASTVVISVGMCACLVFVYAFSQTPGKHLAICAGLFTGFQFVAYLLRDRSNSGGLKMWLEARKPPKPIDYTPKAHRHRNAGTSADNRPATLDTLKNEVETSGSTWIPNSIRSSRPNKRPNE